MEKIRNQGLDLPLIKQEFQKARNGGVYKLTSLIRLYEETFNQIGAGLNQSQICEILKECGYVTSPKTFSQALNIVKKKGASLPRVIHQDKSSRPPTPNANQGEIFDVHNFLQSTVQPNQNKSPKL